jgi:hypothetical protein
MTKFIRIDGGWLNAAHVSRIRQRFFKGQAPELVFERDGKEVGKLTDPTGDIEALLAPVIPAAPGAAAFIMAPLSSDDSVFDGRPDHIYTERVAIVGWRVLSEAAVPIFAEPRCDNETVFIEFPDGRLVAPDDMSYSSREAAEAGLLARAQRDWDSLHADGAQP